MRGAVPCLSADLTTHAVQKLYTLQAMKMGRRARRVSLSEVSRGAVRGFGQ